MVWADVCWSVQILHEYQSSFIVGVKQFHKETVMKCDGIVSWYCFVTRLDLSRSDWQKPRPAGHLGGREAEEEREEPGHPDRNPRVTRWENSVPLISSHVCLFPSGTHGCLNTWIMMLLIDPVLQLISLISLYFLGQELKKKKYQITPLDFTPLTLVTCSGLHVATSCNLPDMMIDEQQSQKLHISSHMWQTFTRCFDRCLCCCFYKQKTFG